MPLWANLPNLFTFLRLVLVPFIIQAILAGRHELALGLFAIAAATVGGLDSAAGAVVSGLAIGVIENLAGAYVVGSDLRAIVPLVAIVAILTLRPAGVFGTERAVRL